MSNVNQLLSQGQQLLRNGQIAAAEPFFRQAVAMQPRNADALAGLGIICNYTQRPAEAIGLFRKAVAIQPYLLMAHANLGAALYGVKNYPEAIAAFRQFLRLQPDQPNLMFSLGSALIANNENDEAILVLQKTIAMKPDYAEARCILGRALRLVRRFDEAAATYRFVLERQPDFNDALRGLGEVLREIAQPAEAVALLRRALQQNPQDVDTHSTMLLTLQFLPETTPGAPKQEAIHWAKRHAPISAVPAYPNPLTPDRQLRIGYVSPDLRHSSVSYFIENLLAFHTEAVEVFCYSDVAVPDVVTQRLITHADHWRHTHALSTPQLADLIRADQIDILIDLAGHTAGNRLPVFAARPAPIQISYLGYIATTGLSQIQYRLADVFTDPPPPTGLTENFYTEELVRLPATFSCYRPPDFAPPVAPLPALANGHITFACMNATAKINADLLSCWTGILQRAPTAHLLFVGAAYATPSVQQRLLTAFDNGGIAASRIEFVGYLSFLDYLRLHSRVDILLDQVPLNNHTVTCHALWMGVPTISQAGDRYASRLGASVLHNLHLTDLLASTQDQYVDIAVALAADLPRLAKLRTELRAIITHSPLMDYPAFARDVESAYRECWVRWCANRSASPAE